MARRLISHVDRPLLLVVAVICILGFYNLASAGKPLGIYLHLRHGGYVLIGAALAMGVAAVHYRNLEGLAYPIFIACVILLVATSFGGKVVNGSRRWLELGPLNVQTSDIAKIAVIIVVARTFHLDRWEGGLTLREIFRPLNVSRPLILLVAVIMVAMFGDALKPPAIERSVGKRFRKVARLREKSPIVTVGRKKGEGTHVRVPYSGVIERHAEIVRVADSQYTVRDLGSEAGTFVNGERVEGEQAIFHGDMLRFGLNQRAELRFKSSVQNIRPAMPWVALVAALCLIAAFYVQLKSGGWSYRDIVAPIDVVALPCALILIQPDLGTTLVVLLIAFSMILYVGLKPASFLALVSGSMIFGVFAWIGLLKPYQKQRVLSFLNPTSDLAGAGYHQHQSLIAIGSGEMWGKGHGHGTQTQLSFLPEQQTDFIFSVWAEEHGFFGCMIVALLFAALILLSLRIALTARDRFGSLLAIGVTAMLFWHTVINMLMVLRLAPVVGVPLPLWSNGGSFAVTVMIGIGILANVSMRRQLF